MREFLSGAAGFIFTLGFIPYIIAILRGQTKPAKVSWLMWAALDSITLAGMLSAHTVNGQIIGAVAGAWIIVILAFVYGKPGWSTLDLGCFVGGIIGLVLWQVTKNPVAAIIMAQFSTFVVSFPTFKTAWSTPQHEDKTAWTIYWSSCVVTILTMPRLSWADSAQPVTFFVIESVVMYALFIRPKLVGQVMREAP
jgi:hypothetical protein